MDKLHLGIEIRDFDLERMGFSLSVLDPAANRQTSEAYLRMTLKELNTFLGALKSAENDIELSTMEPTAGRKPLPATMLAAAEPEASSGALKKRG